MANIGQSCVPDGAFGVKKHRQGRGTLSSIEGEPPLGLLVIGYGNPLRGDDGFGWRVTQALIGLELEDTDLITCHQLTPELAEPLSRVERTVFVDASVSLPPGVLNVQKIKPLESSGLMAHHLSPMHLLTLARKLYARAPDATVISCGAINLSHTEDLSPEVEAAIPKVLEAIQEVHRRRS
jgi:hydrogenase maturation protease